MGNVAPGSTDERWLRSQRSHTVTRHTCLFGGIEELGRLVRLVSKVSKVSKVSRSAKNMEASSTSLSLLRAFHLYFLDSHGLVVSGFQGKRGQSRSQGQSTILDRSFCRLGYTPVNRMVESKFIFETCHTWRTVPRIDFSNIQLIDMVAGAQRYALSSGA
jgi:hypothetical protein